MASNDDDAGDGDGATSGDPHRASNCLKHLVNPMVALRCTVLVIFVEYCNALRIMTTNGAPLSRLAQKNGPGFRANICMSVRVKDANAASVAWHAYGTAWHGIAMMR